MSDDCGEGAIDISDGEVAIAFSLVVIVCIIAYFLKLKLSSDMFIAAIRAVTQLLVLGYILAPVFTYEQFWAVLLVVLAMATMGAREAYATTTYSYGGRMFRDCWIGIIVAMLTSSSVGVFLIIKVTPWYKPQYLLPMIGMILGNSLKCIQLSMDSAMQGFVRDREKVEIYLARGASKWEAARPVIVQATKQGMLPTINQMSIVGLVSIPGMMTGQIIGGTPPLLAAKYQMVILFLITTASAVAVMTVLLFVQAFVFDSADRLSLDGLKKRTAKLPDIVSYIAGFIIQFFKSIGSTCLRVCCRRGRTVVPTDDLDERDTMINASYHPLATGTRSSRDSKQPN